MLLSQYPGAMAYEIGGRVRERRDDTARVFRAYDTAGVETQTLAYDAVENADADQRAIAARDAANGTTLRDKARQAIAVNDTFLALPAPTNAQVLLQVQRLTRENTALIRLVIGALDSTSGT